MNREVFAISGLEDRFDGGWQVKQKTQDDACA